MASLNSPAAALLLLFTGATGVSSMACDNAAKSKVVEAANDARVEVAPPAPLSCSGIRSCIYECKDDKACAAGCPLLAPLAARQKFEAAGECSEKHCAPGDGTCRCEVECFFTGPCAELVDECNEGGTDSFCEEGCH